jgi:predicted chitinase
LINISNILNSVLLSESNLEITDLSGMSKYKKKGTPLKSQKYFILHHTAGRGSAQDVINILNNREEGALGVQYIIDEDGNLFRGLPAGTVGAHVSGKNRRGGPSDLSNSNTEGVEIVGADDTKITLNQCRTALKLIRSLGYSKSSVYGHGDIQSNKQRSEGATCKRYVEKYWSTPDSELPTVDPEIKSQQGKVDDEEEKPKVGNKGESQKVGLSQNFYKGKAASNIELLINKMKQNGITNPTVQAAILGTIGKESGFIPQNEIGYGGTDNNDIRRIFSSTQKLTDDQIDQLKSNNENFFNYVYGPKGAGPGLSNTQPGDGYKYRGRGFNQITGRGNYKAYGLESNPDKMNDVEGAADAAIAFLAKEGSALNNKFSSLDNAIEFFVTRNAGGRKKPGEERKARKVTERFNIGKESSTYDSDVEGDGGVETPDEPKKDKKIKLNPLMFLDPIISLARGDSSALKEETDRIKHIMKKVL